MIWRQQAYLKELGPAPLRDGKVTTEGMAGELDEEAPEAIWADMGCPDAL